MRIYMVRHGETDCNVRGMFYGWHDCDINEKGIAQATSLHEYFKDVEYDKVICSDLLRAKHTAEIIVGDKECEFITNEKLRELSFGDWENTYPDDIHKQYGYDTKNWGKSIWDAGLIPNGESHAQFYDRIVAGFQEIVAENKGKTIMIVAHNGTLCALFAYLTGVGRLGYWNFFAHQGCYNSFLVSGERVLVEGINIPAK
ncbi:histidine phosphatase family protein [Chakrabartyella piscis]|uniref:histidine phosphatase family protein n=1 Tax=Chakrabartyella piscis TaxID=2918914 RepID=UPI0029589C47|nr:histidine phosphatase family protein [Chakrabartyella piscis]